MTKYELLMHKHDVCIEAAGRTDGYIRQMWLNNAEELKNKALNLSIEDAEKEA